MNGVDEERALAWEVAAAILRREAHKLGRDAKATAIREYIMKAVIPALRHRAAVIRTRTVAQERRR